MVMLTTCTRRALRLSVLWRDVTDRLERMHLDMFVAVFDQLAGKPVGWWRGGTAERVPLWSGCHGSSVVCCQRPRLSSKRPTTVGGWWKWYWGC